MRHGRVMSTATERTGKERRRERRSGILRPAGDAMYGAVRWVAGHVHGFYTAVGVFLALGFGLSAMALAGFALIARAMAAGVTQRADVAVLMWLRDHATPAGDLLGLAGAALGSGVAMWVALGAGSIYFLASRHFYSLALLWISLLGGRGLGHLLKAIYERPRPHLFGPYMEALGYRFDYPSSHSFPSGHALISVVIYGTLAFLIARLEPTRRLRRITLAGAGFLILLIGGSRLYLGVHYPSDVLAGYLAGFVWVTTCVFALEVFRYLRFRHPQAASEERDLGRGLQPIREAVHRDPS